MKSKQQHRDDFKKLFDYNSLPSVPSGLEDKIMTQISVHKPTAFSNRPYWFTRNLFLFCLSVFVLATVTLFQFIMPFHFGLLPDINTIALLSTVIFFILWGVELAEGIIRHYGTQKKLAANI